MTRVALFVPCYIDQFYPQVAIAALQVLERLGVSAHVAASAVCCGQPAANAGFERTSAPTLRKFVDTFTSYDRVVVLSGSCAMHVRSHATSVGGDTVARNVTEFCAFLHDDIGVAKVATLGASYNSRVGLHIGCHGLRGMALAKPSELHAPSFNKVRTLLETVQGISFAELRRADECCGFGGSFAVVEPAISAKMGRDRLRDYAESKAQAIVSTDMSCVMHLSGLARNDGAALPMLHVAQVLNSASPA